MNETNLDKMIETHNKKIENIIKKINKCTCLLEDSEYTMIIALLNSAKFKE